MKLLPEIDEGEAKNLLKWIKSIEDGIDGGFNSFQALYDSGKKQNQWIAEYAQATQGQIRSTEGVIAANKTARDSAIKHNAALKAQTFGAKAAAAGMKILAIAGNTLAMVAIAKGIQLAIGAWDNYVHRVEKAREATAESVSTFESLTSEANNLDKKLAELNTQINSLDPIVDADDIVKLKAQTAELETQQKILEERRKLAGLDAENNAVDALTQTDRSDYLTTYRYDELGTKIEDYAYTTEPEELQAIIDSYDTYTQAIKDAEEEQTRLISSGKGNSKEFENQQKIIDKNSESITKARQRARELYAHIEENSKGLIGATEEGKKLKGVIDNLTISYGNFIDNIDGNTPENIVPGTFSDSNTTPIFNLEDEDTAKAIDNFQKKLTDLSSALEKVESQKLSGSELLDLQQQFPELINATDDLDVALNKLVDETLSQVVNYLKLAGASDGLIQTFQQISDEAKGLSTANWAGTFDVFDQAESQMSTLAEFNKALGNSFTITADEARKFAEVFPELLSLGQITSAGLIKFNSDVVNDFINGKQAEINADSEAQITRLENRKAALEAQKATAQAALDLVAAQASGEIDGENQKNTQIAEARDNLVQHLIDLGVEEQNADAVAKELMAGNMTEYDRVVADVSSNVDSNLTNSINDAASNVNRQSGSMINSLFSVAKQAVNTAKSILSIGTENPVGAVKESLSGVSDAIINFNPSDAIGEFKKKLQEDLKITGYQAVDTTVALELDINNYEKQISEIDSQIALLKANGNKSLNSYSNKSGSGSGGSNSSKGKEPTEFDWMEQKITILDSQVDKLKSNIESLVGYKNKNSMTHTAIDVLTEKMGVLQQMHDKYMEKADSLGLSQEYINKIQSGTIEIESIGDENLANVIKEYQDLFDKALNVNSRIIETKKSIHDLNLSKLDNIINQFEQMTDIQSQMIDTEKQLMDLREKSGEEIYADDYISLAGKQLKLTRQNVDAYNELASEMSRLNLQEGTEEWKKYNDQLQEYKNNMISAADAIEQYKDVMTDLVYKGLNDFISAMDSINGTISTMNSLIGDTNLIDEFGNLTDRGLAQIALYAHQMTNAKQEAAEYAEAIKSLEDALDSGLITQDEYNSMLQEYTASQESAVKSSKEARDAILSLVKEGILAEIDAKKKLVDETKAALDAEKDLHDYQKSITEKQDNISKLERQIAALSNSTNRNDIAQRLQLQSQLAQAKEELYELQYDHEIEQRKEALDDEYNSFEESKQKEADELDSSLDAQNAAIEKYLNEVKTKYSTVYGVLTQYGDEYSLSAIEDLTKPWESGSEAADLCANAIGDVVANIQYEIDGLDFSSLYELVDLLNQVGMGGYGEGFSSAYEDVTDQGSWQKGQGGKWWYGNSNDDYVSGDIYTINGKQYGFDDDGYMVTGWRDDFGDWRYFEPANGEMVKSQWRKSKNNEWYYLDKDGIMAADMAVKAREDDGYYYLDDEGKWDGETLTAEQVRKLGYTIGYKKGRKRITHDQIAWTQEDKPEIITRPSDGALLTPLKLGDGVINGDLTQNLLDIARNPNSFVQDILARSMPNYKVPEFEIVRNQPVEINSPLVQIDGTGLSANEVAAIIKNETRDIDKRVAKSIKQELLGK